MGKTSPNKIERTEYLRRLWESMPYEEEINQTGMELVIEGPIHYRLEHDGLVPFRDFYIRGGKIRFASEEHVMLWKLKYA